MTQFRGPWATKLAEKEPPKGAAEAEYPQPLMAAPTYSATINPLAASGAGVRGVGR